MKNLTVISFSLITLFLSVGITSNISSSSSNQVYATLENTNDKITDSIKKTCPNYEGNGDIEGIVTDIIKACIVDNNQPPTTPGPDTKFPKNILDIEAVLQTNGGSGADIQIVDPTGRFLNSYFLSEEPNDRSVQDQFVVPIGDTYTVTVIGPGEEGFQINIESSSCKGTGSECQGTMGITKQSVNIQIENPPPS